MNSSCASHWVEASHLVEIEELIREGYIGEARFAIRKMMETQLAVPEGKIPDIFPAHQILEKINQKLLMSKSLESLQDITDMMDEVRSLYGLPRLSVHVPAKTKNVRYLFPARSLRIFPGKSLRTWFRSPE